MRNNVPDGPLSLSRLAALRVPTLDARQATYRAQRGQVVAAVKTGPMSYTVFRWVTSPTGSGAWTRQASI